MAFLRPFQRHRARSFQPKFQPVRPGKVVPPQTVDPFFETFPFGPNRSIECWTEISGNFGWMDRAHHFVKKPMVAWRNEGCGFLRLNKLYTIDVSFSFNFRKINQRITKWRECTKIILQAIQRKRDCWQSSRLQVVTEGKETTQQLFE